MKKQLLLIALFLGYSSISHTITEDFLQGALIGQISSGIKEQLSGYLDKSQLKLVNDTVSLLIKTATNQAFGDALLSKLPASDVRKYAAMALFWGGQQVPRVFDILKSTAYDLVQGLNKWWTGTKVEPIYINKIDLTPKKADEVNALKPQDACPAPSSKEYLFEEEQISQATSETLDSLKHDTKPELEKLKSDKTEQESFTAGIINKIKTNLMTNGSKYTDMAVSCSLNLLFSQVTKIAIVAAVGANPVGIAGIATTLIASELGNLAIYYLAPKLSSIVFEMITVQTSSKFTGPTLEQLSSQVSLATA